MTSPCPIPSPAAPLCWPSAGTRVSATITDIVATDGNSDQSLNDASWAASVAAPPSGNANLAGLSCGDYALSPAFSAGTTEYSVTVPYDVSRLPLDYRAADGGADVSVSGNQLSVGVNTVVLTVTAANGASRRYTISVTRQPDPNVTLSSDASLSELTPSTGQLSPAFSPEITEYAVYVPYETSKISLSATAKDSKALGVTQPDASLKEGDNLLTVTCTAEDGATRDYTVHVVRMPAFAGTLPQIGQPEPEDPSPEEPQTQTGPFRALWTALCAPVDLPLNRWLPMYAILAAGLVILLVLLWLLMKPLNAIVTRLPLISTVNGLGGAALGLVCGGLTLFVAVWAMQRFGWLLTPELIDSTTLLKFFATQTPLGLLAAL